MLSLGCLRQLPVTSSLTFYFFGATALGIAPVALAKKKVPASTGSGFILKLHKAKDALISICIFFLFFSHCTARGYFCMHFKSPEIRLSVRLCSLQTTSCWGRWQPGCLPKAAIGVRVGQALARIDFFLLDVPCKPLWIIIIIFLTNCLKSAVPFGT